MIIVDSPRLLVDLDIEEAQYLTDPDGCCNEFKAGSDKTECGLHR